MAGAGRRYIKKEYIWEKVDEERTAEKRYRGLDDISMTQQHLLYVLSYNSLMDSARLFGVRIHDTGWCSSMC